MAQDNANEDVLSLDSEMAPVGLSVDDYPELQEEQEEEILDSDYPESLNDLSLDELADLVTYQESRGVEDAVSPAGAKGVMQLMDATGQELFEKHQDELAEAGIKADSYDPFDPDQNRFLGKIYLQDQLDTYGDAKLALAAYNAGPGVVNRYLSQTDNGTFEEVNALMEQRGSYGETRDYVAKISGRFDAKKGSPSEPSTSSEVRAGLGDTQSLSNKPPTLQFDTFEEAAAYQLTRPEFDSQSTSDRLNNLSELYYSKD